MFLVLLFSFLLSTTAARADLPQNCSELGALYKADSITNYEEQCFDEPTCMARQLTQLREAARSRDPKFDPASSDSELEAKYGSDHSKLILGTDALDGTSLFLNLVATTTFFDAGTTTIRSISIVDGKARIGSETCDSPLAPLLSQARMKSMCHASADYIAMDSCLDGGSDFRIDNLTDDPTQATISFTRSTDGDVIKLLCVGTIQRVSDEVLDVTCLTPESE